MVIENELGEWFIQRMYIYVLLVNSYSYIYVFIHILIGNNFKMVHQSALESYSFFQNLFFLPEISMLDVTLIY